MSRPFLISRSSARLAGLSITLPLSLAFAQFVGVCAAQPAPPVAQDQAALAAKTAPVIQAAQTAPLAPVPAMQVLIAQGVVRDSNGKPLQGAWVEAVNAWSTVEPSRFQSAPVQTDEAGHFVVQARFSPRGLDEFLREFEQSKGTSRLLVAVYAPGYALTQQMVVAEHEANAALPNTDFTLERGLSASGQVVDADGKPTPNIAVEMSSMRPLALDSLPGRLATIRGAGFNLEGVIARALRGVTDGEGRYTLRDLPRGSVKVALSDPQYVRTNTWLPVSADAANRTIAPLVVRPGASVRGRALYPDGKPVGNVMVTVRNADIQAPAIFSDQTNPDGTFLVRGVSDGHFILAVQGPSPNWAGFSVPNVILKLGDVTNVGDLKIGSGVLLSGQVRDADTRAPLQDVTVTAALKRGRATSVQTDAQGRYQLRTETGDTTFSLSTLPEDYVTTYETTRLKIGPQSRIAPTFTLRRGLTLSGTARDERGRPAAGAVLDLGDTMGSVGGVVVDAQGNWSMRGLDPNSFSEGPLAIKSGGEWTMAAPLTVGGRQTAPLSVRLRRIVLQDVTVKVVTPDGQPITGAKVVARISGTLNSDLGSTTRLVSDTKGEITLSQLRLDQTVQLTATKKGYLLAQSGKVNKAINPAPGATGIPGTTARKGSDIVLQPLTARVSGRVLDAEGQPVVGARVALLFPNDLRDLPQGSALTDMEGRFTLQGLPTGELTFGVTKGRAYAQKMVHTNAPVATVDLALGAPVPLSPVRDVQGVAAQLERWIRADTKLNAQLNQSILTQLAVMLAHYDLPRAQQVMSDGDEALKAAFTRAAAADLAGRGTPGTSEWAKRTLPRLANDTQALDTRLLLGALLVKTDPATAQALYDAIAPGVTPTGFGAPEGTRYAQLAALALALHSPDADGWLQALTLSINAAPNNEATRIGQWTTFLAGGDVTATRQWVTQLKPAQQVVALSALVQWAAPRDLLLARQLLQNLEAVLDRPDFPVEPETIPDDGQYQPTSADQRDSARRSLGYALLPTDPQAALALAGTLRPGLPDTRFLRNTAQVLAATPNDAETMRVALKTLGQRTGELSSAAALLREKLPQVSQEGFEAARTQMVKAEDEDGYDTSVASYAYARADVAPEESRLLLENAWLRGLSALNEVTAPEDEEVRWERTLKLLLIARAMIPLDVARANEMAEQIPGIDFYLGSVRRSIVRWLLSDATERLIMSPEREAYKYEGAE